MEEREAFLARWGAAFEETRHTQARIARETFHEQVVAPALRRVAVADPPAIWRLGKDGWARASFRADDDDSALTSA